ncbi:hypothetical protein BgiBS90_029174, partial [Biomphalaria glabrata]
ILFVLPEVQMYQLFLLTDIKFVYQQFGVTSQRHSATTRLNKIKPCLFLHHFVATNLLLLTTNLKWERMDGCLVMCIRQEYQASPVY